jgi:curved DNA-binding protein CbpA
MKRLEELNHYEILEVSPTASQGEIRQAYERARRTYTRDSLGIYSLLNEKEIENVSWLIEKAYKTIGNENTRREYDKSLDSFQKETAKATEPPFSVHFPQPSVPLYSDETKPLAPDQREKVEKMISQPGFEYAGSALRKIREALELDLKEISMRTKVSRMNLDFIEAENYTHLPALVYLKGFVSEYAKCLGLDPHRVLEDYMSRYRSWEQARET